MFYCTPYFVIFGFFFLGSSASGDKKSPQGLKIQSQKEKKNRDKKINNGPKIQTIASPKNPSKKPSSLPRDLLEFGHPLYYGTVFMAKENFYLSFLRQLQNQTLILKRFPFLFSQGEKILQDIQRWKAQQDKWIKFLSSKINGLKKKREDNNEAFSSQDSYQLFYLEKIYNALELFKGHLGNFFTYFQNQLGL